MAGTAGVFHRCIGLSLVMSVLLLTQLLCSSKQNLLKIPSVVSSATICVCVCLPESHPFGRDVCLNTWIDIFVNTEGS